MNTEVHPQVINVCAAWTKIHNYVDITMKARTWTTTFADASIAWWKMY